MIVAEKMQDTMNKKARDFIAKAVPQHRRLPLCGGHRDDHIAEKRASEAGESALTQRKREDIRSTILVPVAPIERAHALVGDEHQAQIPCLGASGRQDGLGRPAQPYPIDGHSTLTVLQENGHRVSLNAGGLCGGRASRRAADRP